MGDKLDEKSIAFYENKIATLEKRLEDKSNFLASMSHEIRTPMNAIIALSQLLLEEEELSQNLSEHLTTIVNSSKMLLGIINDILDYSKLGAGKLKLEKIPFDINMTLDYVADMTTIQAQEKGLEIVFDIDHNVRANFMGDPLRISQIILNLMSNAIKFTDSGSVSLKVRNIIDDKEKAKLEFEVRDTGIGISKAQIDNLFQDYAQAEVSTTRKYGGTGLGLAISKRLVNLMDGKIWAKTNKDKGSTFFVTIPLDVEFPMEHRVYRLSSQQIMNKKVLIIDTHIKSSEALRYMLAYFHIESKIVTSFRDAKKLLDEKLFDIVFIDDLVCDSNSFIKLYKKSYNIKIVLIRNWISDYTKCLIDENFIDSSIKRPFNQQMLLDALSNLYDVGKKIENKVYTKNDLKNFSNKHILLAEDDLINQKIIEGLLKDTPINLTITNNGKELVDTLEKIDHVDLILMDIRMPVMDGYEASKMVRKNHRFDTIPIIALTGNSSKEDIDKTKEFGMNDYIAKPIELKVFYTKVVKYL